MLESLISRGFCDFFVATNQFALLDVQVCVPIARENKCFSVRHLYRSWAVLRQVDLSAAGTEGIELSKSGRQAGGCVWPVEQCVRSYVALDCR